MRGARPQGRVRGIVVACKKFAGTVLLPVVLAAALAACAASRSVIDVQAGRGTAAASSRDAGPTTYAKIEVEDARQFQLDPGDPSIPSLGSAEELRDPRLTARAVGRKRNTYGMALGDIVLPEGSTVADLVRAVAKNALWQKGYVVVEPSSADYARALPMGVKVTQFWAWVSPGLVSLPFRCDWSLTLTAPEIVGPSPVALSGRADHSAAAGFDSEWQKTLDLGVANMSEKLRQPIKPAAAARGAPTS
jgi:hypothetical protein